VGRGTAHELECLLSHGLIELFQVGLVHRVAQYHHPVSLQSHDGLEQVLLGHDARDSFIVAELNDDGASVVTHRSAL
jgi:hypothetical protein